MIPFSPNLTLLGRCLDQTLMFENMLLLPADLVFFGVESAEIVFKVIAIARVFRAFGGPRQGR
jgi:hypothetical protein